MILETVFAHGSDYIEWYEASGCAGSALRRIAPERLRIALTRAPRDLQLVHKTTATALWRKRPPTLSGVLAGVAREADLQPPAQAAYALEGEISDPSGAYLPRLFSVDCGAVIGHRIGLYRSPLAARYGRAGGVFGRIRLAGRAAAWSLVVVRVTPPLGAALEFTAQADANGEFILPLDRLPALGVDALVKTYPATLRIAASPLAVAEQPFDPGKLVAHQVAVGEDAAHVVQFSDSLSFAVTPGSVSRVTSPGQALLLLQPN
ncbi:MAG TPA: hypothetical protein PLV48_15365 [Rhodocyclaceae bacterium]|nr:hypothetical protein [Accumulibacter sp.]MDS4014744.1 hypothetical protein [Accumulibacter sp.]HNA05261.1 hypothetical protein [Rhodocyclaceae bacterium]